MTLQYVLITPARNEATFIRKTIQSVINQTVLPKRWVIVSDGSTDGTDEIVNEYVQDHEWLELVRLPQKQKRNFASKAWACDAGYEQVKDLAFDVVGNIDADVSFNEEYCSYLLTKFAANSKLGVAGTHYVEDGFHSFSDSYINVDHVNGGCQFFRRECYEQIDGYQPIKGGGIDWLAVTTARMKNWTTRSFGKHVFHHHRKLGTAACGELVARFNYGKKDYVLGGHPLWELFRGGFQMTKKPYITGGLFILLGYFGAMIGGQERAVSNELMIFHRREQLDRLKQLLLNRLKLGRESIVMNGSEHNSR